jgi:hypothetical protein
LGRLFFERGSAETSAEDAREKREEREEGVCFG